MAIVDAATAAQRWAQQFGASSAKWTAGVQAVTVAPGAAAARQKAVWQQNTINAADKWAANTAAVGLTDWQQMTVSKGQQRLASGAQAGQAKIEAAFTSLLPFIDQARSSLPPRGDLSANINRMVAFTQKMATYKRR